MDAGTLVRLMKGLTLYFGKSGIKGETLDEWMKDLAYIPNEPVPWIEAKIKANRYPDNPPQAIRKLWYQWLEEHPDRQDKEKKGCSECESGYFFVLKDGVSYCFRCDRCNKHGQSSIPTASKYSLQSAGYTLHWCHGTTREIKSMPAYESGRRAMPKGVVDWADKRFKPVIEQEWNDQF